ncbi:MAG: PAS domain S-box protein [Cyclobacteriaceae bacterium]|nr:PAS domain S-box protein [Cyclobacteriaceae bacterium]
MTDVFYSFNNIRALITMMTIGLTLILLKSVVEKNEEINRELLTELARKNEVIKQQAEAEVYKLNEKLTNNLQLLGVSENKYRSLFEQASDFIAIVDFNGNFIDVNESWCTTFGYSKDELMNLNVEDLMDPVQLALNPMRYSEIQRGAHLLSQRRMRRSDNSIIEVESNVKKLQEDKMLVIARDVTQLREAQHQIALSEARFRGAFENSATGMALISTDTKYLKVNRALCQMVGYTEEQLLNKSVEDITFLEDAGKDFHFQQQLLRGEQITFQCEKRYLHCNGDIVWVNTNVSLIKDIDGSPLYFVSQIENITATKLAKEQLLIYEANMKATINNTELMIWSVDKNFNLLMFNNQYATYIQEHYGVKLEVGLKVFAHLNGPQLGAITDEWTPHYLNALAGNRITFEETRFGIDLQYSLSPIIEKDKVIGVSVFADDITERISHNKELAEANKKIGELKLMALRSAMSPHFIFNVLNSIQFFIAKNDRLNAINYLSTFSKLVRSILTHSVKNEIRLSDEIEMLKNYVNLEMTRFENKFTFNLSVGADLETEAILIPSLLIQPYVENAILHGLYNRQESGELSINIERLEDVLVFEIVDNGVGREAAMKLQKYNLPTHESMGIGITEERLKLINQNIKTAFEIEDLMNQSGPCGTKVNIRISYQTV